MPTRQEILHNWRISKLRLDACKKSEMEWRVAACATFFPDPIIGTNTYQDGSLKLVLTETITLEKDAEKLYAGIRAVAVAKPDELLVLNHLLYMKPALAKPAFEQLSAEAQKLLAPVITIKQSAPALKFSGDKDE